MGVGWYFNAGRIKMTQQGCGMRPTENNLAFCLDEGG